MNSNDYITAALKRADANFATAPRSAKIKMLTWIGCLILVVIVALNMVVFAVVKDPLVGWITLSTNAGVIAIFVACWFASGIRNITLSGQTLLIKLTFWTTRFDLAGLRSAGVDAQALKGCRHTVGNGGFGAFHGWFSSERMGDFRAYATDTDRCVVLRWKTKCVVVSPKDTEYFIEEVCKRTGARRQD